MKFLKFTTFFVIIFILTLGYFYLTDQRQLKVGDNQKEDSVNSKNKVDKSFTHLKPSKSPSVKATSIFKPKGRFPSSIAPVKKEIMRQGRILVGVDLIKYKDPSIPLDFINQYNPEWQKELQNRLSKTLLDAQIKVYPLKDIIQIKHGKARYIQKVTIETTIPSSPVPYTYNASIDSQTGHILSTWNRVVKH